LRIAERKEGINSEKAQLLRAKVLAEKGRNWMKWAEKQETEEERGRLLDLANGDLIKGVNIYQEIEEDHHGELGYIVRQLGEVQFKREAYEDAIKDYDRALNLVSFVEQAEKRQSRERGELLCLKGTAFSFKGDTKEALTNYEAALQTYREIYGSDHNRPSALAIGNLGRVYINAGEEEKARDCLKVCRDILADIAGQHDADYLHFQAVEDNLHQYIP
jgi:tetratricopeptide (TPR) repeat protein